MEPGTQVGAYQILRKLGEGGMGVVYEATHSLIGRHAAIKVLLAAYSQNQEIVNRFFNEARAATAVADPGIVQIFDFGYHTDGSAYIVMEFLEGEPLDVRLSRVGRLAVADLSRIGRQVANALSAAHRRGIVHRDLKPENVFLVYDPEVIGGERAKVLDFGIAKLGDDKNRSTTRTGSLIGTPEYMSPEQCRGAGSVKIDHRADIYALGCILYALATGRPPFQGEGVGDLIVAHVTEAPKPPSHVAPELPAELDAVILRCLAKAPSERFQTMVELSQALAAIQQAAMAIPGYMPMVGTGQISTSYTAAADDDGLDAPTEIVPSMAHSMPPARHPDEPTIHVPPPSPHDQPTPAPYQPTPDLSRRHQPTPAPPAKTITGASAEMLRVTPKKTRRAVAIGSAAAAIVIGAVIAYSLVSSGDKPSEPAKPASTTQPMTPVAPIAAPTPEPPKPSSPPVETSTPTSPSIDAGVVEPAVAETTEPKKTTTTRKKHSRREEKPAETKPACPPDDLMCVQ